MEFRLSGNADADLTPDGVRLGRYLGGDVSLPREEQTVVLPFEELKRHLLILGRWGSGTTETALRVAREVAARTEAQVIYFNPQHEPDQPERFRAAMEEAGREVRSFPEEPMDFWRGDWHQIYLRFGELIANPSLSDPAANLALEVALRHPNGPPRSWTELRQRLLDPGLFGPSEEQRKLARAARDVALHFKALLWGEEELFDGQWAWEDASAAYVSVPFSNPLQRQEALERFLFLDLQQYFRTRKERDRFCLIVIEASAPSRELGRMLTDAGSFNTGVVLCVSGAAAPDEEANLLAAVDCGLLHDMRLRGGLEYLTDLIPESEVIGQPPGTAWAIRNGGATQLAVYPALEKPVSR